MSLITAPLLALLADRFDKRKKFLTLSFSGAMLGLIMVSFSRTFPYIFFSIAFYHFFRSSLTPMTDSIVLHISKKYALDFGKMRLFGSLFYAISACVSGIIWDLKGYDYMLILSGISFLPAIITSQIIEDPPMDKPYHLSYKFDPYIKDLLRDKGLVVILFASFFMQAALYISSMFSGIFIDDLGGASWVIGLIFCLGSVSEASLMFISDRIERAISKVSSLIIAYSLCIISLLLAAVVSNPLGFLAMTVLRGFAFSLYYIVTVKVLDKRVPHHLSSIAQALFTAVTMGLAPLLGSPIAGLIYDLAGTKTLFVSASLLPIISLILITQTSKENSSASKSIRNH